MAGLSSAPSTHAVSMCISKLQMMSRGRPRGRTGHGRGQSGEHSSRAGRGQTTAAAAASGAVPEQTQRQHMVWLHCCCTTAVLQNCLHTASSQQLNCTFTLRTQPSCRQHSPEWPHHSGRRHGVHRGNRSQGRPRHCAPPYAGAWVWTLCPEFV